MGELTHQLTRRIVRLSASTMAGRSEGSTILLVNPAASTHHGYLLWTGGRWEARDLGSTNGTWVNGRPLPPKETAPLMRGAVLRFGADEEQWELTDDGPPAVVATRQRDGEIRVAKDGALMLPSEDDVRVCVTLSEADRWLVHDETGERHAQSGERLQIGDEAWELWVPASSRAPGTYKESGSLGLSRATLRFFVSPGDKHVRLEVVEGNRLQSLRERACFVLLYQLALRRLEDAQKGISEAEQGWIHVIDVQDLLGKKEEGPINVDIHRAKGVFHEAAIEGSEGLVDRRRREIRIGTGRLEIVRP